MEYRIIRKDGAIRWVDDYGHLAHLSGYGDVFYVFIGDITEKHYAIEEIRRREKVYEGMNEQFKALAENSLTVFRSNITTGVIEEARGRDLYDTDYVGGSIVESARVRDEEIAAEHARIVLDEVGIKADTCYSGPDALRMLEIQQTKHEPYNLVLLDWKMPDMDGLEVAREIRKRYDRETTVIILTSFNWDEIMDEAFHIGVDSFLAKPLFASNVIDEFERVARKNNMSLYREKKRAELSGRRILMAEDVLINAEIMKQIIVIRDAKIDHAENGRIALEMFEESPVGYYVMDIRMPEMDGLEATAAIRALDRPDAKSIPIVALTANAFDEDVQRSLQIGMNAHLSKPVEPEYLYQTLEELIWEADENKKGEKA